MNNVLDDQVKIMKLNNVCVSYMELGEYHQAVRTLTEAIGSIKTSLHTSAEIAPSTSERVPGFTSPRGEQVCTAEDVSSRMGYVFCRPIAFPEETIKNATIGSDSTRSTIVIKVNSIVIMYNLALAFQLLAASDKELQKAIKLYHLCHRMLVTSNCQDIQYEPSLIMALANNLGVLYAAVGDTSRSQSFFQHLLSTQMFVLSNSRCLVSATTNTNLNEVDFKTATTTYLDAFWNNTLQFVLQDHTAPVA